MGWVFAAVGLAAVGLVVLAVLGVRVWVAAAGLGREVERTRRLLAQRRAALQGNESASVRSEG
jgi:hypothetical protein